jgi:hypothetical protein
MGMRPAAPKLVLAGALSSLAIPGSALAGQASLSPATGAPGSSVVVHGTGFPGSKRVTVKLTGRSAVRVRASSGGSFTARVKAPSGRRGWITVTSRSGSRKVVNRFYATRGGAGQVVEVASTSGRRLRLTPASITAGQTMRIDGAGFKKGRTVRLSGFGLSRSYRAGRSGRFTAFVSLPDSLKGGSYRATLRAAGVRLVVGVRVRARATPTAPTTPTTPTTPGAPSTQGAPQPLPLPAPTQPAPVKNAPVNTALPTIAGAATAQVGKVLTATTGSWTRTPTSYAYRWERCGDGRCAPISGATARTYTPVETTATRDGDTGLTLRVVVTAANADGAAAAASAATKTVKTAVPPPTGVVANWHMDDTTRVMSDASGRGHTGTLHQKSSGVSIGQPGVLGTAFGFDGAVGYVSVPNAPDLSPGDRAMTITLWMKTDKLSGGPANPTEQDWDLIRSGLYYDGAEYKMEYYPQGQAMCGFRGTTGYAEVFGSRALNDNVWHKIECVKTATQVKVLVDGVVDGPKASKNIAVGTIDVAKELVIGAHPGSEFFDGLLDEVSIRYS